MYFLICIAKETSNFHRHRHREHQRYSPQVLIVLLFQYDDTRLSSLFMISFAIAWTDSSASLTSFSTMPTMVSFRDAHCLNTLRRIWQSWLPSKQKHHLLIQFIFKSRGGVEHISI
jgi:hypothetical protein